MSSLRLLSETGSEESREAPNDTGLEHQNMDLGIFDIPTVNLTESRNSTRKCNITWYIFDNS